MQTIYSTQPESAFAGLLADSGASDMLSRAFEGATDAPFGVAMVLGTLPDTQAKLPSATGQVVVGVAVHKHRDPLNTDGASTAGITAGDTMSLVRSGRVWVRVEEAVTPGQAVFFRHTVGTGTQLGAFRNDADTATCDALAGARWVTSAAGAGLAQLEINVP